MGLPRCCGPLRLLLVSLLALVEISCSAEEAGAPRLARADIAVTFDEELQAKVYSRPGLDSGKWKPHPSVVGFHISKFLGGAKLPADVQKIVDNSVLAAPEPVYRTPLRFVINYAEKPVKEQEENCMSAVENHADVCIAYQWESLSLDFRTRNEKVLSSRRGAGFWIWKPYLIFNTLLKIQDGDVLVYSEYAASFKKDLGVLFGLPASMNQDIVFFSHPRGEEQGARTWSKGDVLVIFDCYDNNCTSEAKHVTAAFSVWKKSEESVLLSSYWMSYMEDPRVSTDMPDTLNFPNLMFRQGEAQEAAAASLIMYKWSLQPAPKEPIQDTVQMSGV